jgi:hypothetical protein|tara:strand:+ start:121 stop:618 length:498 start_codon:yes stop_codon:yes gene_type:complete
MPPRERQRPNIGYDRSGAGGDLNVWYDSPGPPQDRDDLGYLKYDRPFFRDLKNKIKNQPGTGELRPNVDQPWNNPGPGSFWNVGLQSGDNSGVMAAMANNPMVQQAKGFYDLFDPWIPNVDVGENSFGYEFEKPILGGTLGYGFDYDWDDEDVGAFFNWKIGLGR